MLTIKVSYQGHSITLTRCRTQQAACRLAFQYWLNEGIIKRQPKSSSDWPSTFEGVECQILSLPSRK
jgi:hypothetical protein